ncbi:hypothetical protein OEZ85_011762 [Tetradesmus obliquus]|uniref:Protein kinase domain-containing protein n=1 Tax=Tetradesmus obliquus TaxID=3088 RepID=A0ABY8TTQ4_TETOB|nr:hypothetical protein OEZ85_011762 [Tetradesmus obliquus]
MRIWARLYTHKECNTRWAATTNERRGNGASVDFFRGRPGSVLALYNTQRVRPACTSASISTELIMTSYARSSKFPNKGMQQRVRSITTTFQGKVFSKQLQLDDFATDLPLAYQEGRGLLGGFTILVQNTTRICVATVSEDCLKIKSSDACVNSLINEQMENASHEAAAARQQPTVLVAAVVGCVVGGVLLAAAAVVWLVRRRRRATQQQQQRQLDKSSDGSDGSSSRHVAAGSGSGSSPHGPDIEQGLIKISAAPSAAAAADVKSSVDQPQPQLLDTRGWQMTTESTAPSLSSARDDHIQWGFMLGAGSFGKVYKGFWGGREVTIKVIEHDSETTAALENEVTLLLSFNHPNIPASQWQPERACPGQDNASVEFCDQGTLANLAATKWLPELEGDEQMLRRLLLLRDAVRGLQALHAACVVHGDLNARNVLVSSSRCAPYGLVAKLADLGLSRVIKQHSIHRTTNTVGTLSHMPPEMLRFGRMSPAADSYAFGIMLLTLWTGQEAFRKLHYGQ